MSKLLPCPFCGEAPEWHGAAPPGNEDASWASCETEGCPVTKDCECGGLAYFPSAPWNHRPIESALRSRVEALVRDRLAPCSPPCERHPDATHCCAACASEHARSSRLQVEELKEMLARVAYEAHESGTKTAGEALVRIRRLTLPYWKGRA